MAPYVYIFDLDSTITKLEILPEISKMIGKDKEMRELTEKTMKGEIPFKHSFIQRVNILKDISVKQINNIISEIPLNEKIVQFINENKESCYIVTGNLDVWISGLMHKIGMDNHYFCSKAIDKDDKIDKVISVIDKRLTAEQFVQPIVSVGDGDNDVCMLEKADIGIAMANASLACKQAADVICGSVHESGIATFVKEYLK